MLLQAAFLIAAGFIHTALRWPCANAACHLPQPRVAVCAAADAENNDALPSMRETLPLVTPGPYLDSTLDTVIDTVLDAALDAWLDASWDVSRLKAKLQDQVAAGTEDAAPSLIRVCGGSGWVVHGLVLEYSNGLRTGFFVENDGSPLSLWDDAAMQQRGGVWHEVFPASSSSQSRAATRSCGLLATCAVWSCCTSPRGEASSARARTPESLARRLCTQLLAAACSTWCSSPPFLSMAAAPACSCLAGRKARQCRQLWPWHVWWVYVVFGFYLVFKKNYTWWLVLRMCW